MSTGATPSRAVRVLPARGGPRVGSAAGRGRCRPRLGWLLASGLLLAAGESVGQQPVGREPPLLAQLEWPGDVREVPLGGAWWIWPVVALVLASGLAFRRRARPPAAETAPAAARATALAALRALPVPPPGAAFAPFYTELKTIVRLHASERFAVPGPVRTSEELRRSLGANSDLDACLSACDAVLFAAHQPDAAAHGDAWRAALQWLQATAAEGA